MTTKKIRFYELAMSGGYHVEINSGLVLIASKIYPNFKFVFYGEKRHIKSLENCCLLKSVEYKPLPFFPNSVLETILLRDFVGCIYSFLAFFKSKNKDILFFTNILPFSHWVIFILNLIFKRDCFICLHGQLEAYLPGNKLRFTKYYFGLQLPIYKNDIQNKYVVFGDIIYTQIKGIFNINSKCIVIDHPYIYDDNPTDECALNFPIKIGHIGVGDLGKGTQYIFELADLLRDYILQSKLKIYIVGKLNKDLRHLDNGLVDWFVEPLPLDDFKIHIKQLHFSLFFRDKNTGTVVASGSFLDAVKYLKPYLAIQNPYIAFYNNKFPESGVLFEDVKMMALFIADFVDNLNNAEYSNKINSLKKLQNSLSLNSIADNFKEQL
jgi:hypothetical protein